jgi:putative transposase
VQRRKRKNNVAQIRVHEYKAQNANERWSMDFVTNRLQTGQTFRVLTIVGQYIKECLILESGISLAGNRVVACLNEISKHRPPPKSITVDNGSEFAGRALDAWAYKNAVKLDFLRPGKPVENAFIESFNSRLRNEFLNTEVFFDIADARKKLEEWKNDYNNIKPHSAL